MAVEYFPCLFRIEGVDHYVIWYSDDRDGLVRENGRVVSWCSLAKLCAYAAHRGLTLQSAEVTAYNWDAIERWCDDPLASGIAVGSFLDAWNMILDTIPAGAESGLFMHAYGRSGGLYQKLFRAKNLPAMTPPGAEYHPVWTRGEVESLAQILRLGIAEVSHQLDDPGIV